MVALQSCPPLISRNPKGNPVFWTEFLQLSHHAAGDDREAFGVEGIHHGFEEGKLALDCVREKIGIDEDGIGWNEGGVVLEEEGGGDLGTARSVRRC